MALRAQCRISILLVVCTMIYGCARFNPSLNQNVLFGGTRIPTVEHGQDGISVAIEEFASADKSRQTFDADVVASGVLPLLFRFDGKGDGTFRISALAIKAYLDNQPLTALSAETAARQAATRDYVGKALGWSILSGPFIILAWPGTIVGSALHTRNVNSRIIKHFESLEFKGAMVRPKQSASGFVYFEVPSDPKVLKTLAETKKLQNLKVELLAVPEQDGTNIMFAIPLPSIDLTASAKN